jgi:hypothetical protein
MHRKVNGRELRQRVDNGVGADLRRLLVSFVLARERRGNCFFFRARPLGSGLAADEAHQLRTIARRLIERAHAQGYLVTGIGIEAIHVANDVWHSHGSDSS